MSLRIHLLGRFRAIRPDGTDIAFPTHSTAALLVLLALHPGRRFARQALAQRLWPDKDLRFMASNLRLSLYRLRKALGSLENAIVSQRSQLWLAPERVWVDTAAFEATGDVGLLTGPLLEDWNDEWLTAERDRFDAAILSALSRQATRALAEGAPQTALDLARRLAQTDSLHEEAHRLIMSAHIALGEPAAALQQYRVCRALLQDELGVEPSAETQALANQARQASPGAPARVGQGLFIGREAELRALLGIIYGSPAGAKAVILGEPGMGKTTLLETALHACEERLTLRVTCHDGAAPPPYQLLADLMRSLGLDRLRQAPAGVRNALCLLLPELGVPSRTTPGEDRHRMLTACTEVLRACPRFVAAVDDLQWADPASIAALESIWPRLAPGQAVLLATCRKAALADREDLAEWIRREELTGGLTTLALQGLSAEETGRLAAALSPGMPQQQADWLHQQSAGNPLLITELVRTGFDESDPLPPAIVRTMQGRLLGLSDEARAVLRAAAVLGQAFDALDLCGMLDWPEADLLPQVEDLTVRGLFVEDGRQYRFYHAKFREVVLGEMSLARRQALHRAAARVVAPPARVAYHAEQGLLWRPAAEALVKAGDEAFSLAALDEALSLYSRAVVAVHRSGEDLFPALCAALLGKAGVYKARGQMQEEADALDAAEVLVAPRYEAVHLAKIVTLRTELLSRMGRPAEALEEGRRAVYLAGQPGVPLPYLATAHRALADLHWRFGRPKHSLRAGETALAIARKSACLQVQAQCLIELASSHTVRARFEKMRQYADEASRLAIRLGEMPTLMHAQAFLATYDQAMGHHGEAIARYRDLIALIRSQGYRHMLGIRLASFASLLRRCGRPLEAVAPAKEASEIAEAIGDPKMLSWAKRELAWAHLAEGDPGAALALADETLGYCAKTRNVTDRDAVHEVRVRALLELGRLDEALEWALEQRPWHANRSPSVSLAVCVRTAAVLLRAGRPTEAARWVRPLQKWRRRLGGYCMRGLLAESLLVEAQITGSPALGEQALQVAAAYGYERIEQEAKAFLAAKA